MPAMARGLGFHEAIVEELTAREGEASASESGVPLRNPSSLVVLGEGLGLSQVVAELLVRLLTTPLVTEPTLVILVGFTEVQRRSVLAHVTRRRQATHGAAMADLPTVGEVDAAVGSAERSKLYAAGGCLFVTTRILTVDLLQRRLSPRRVAGVCVGSAHRMKDDSGEAFCVRMFRGQAQGSGGSGEAEARGEGNDGNVRGFVHAFTDEPTSFAGTFKVEHVMKALQLRRVFLWPRFEARVQESLQPAPAAEVEAAEEKEEKEGEVVVVDAEGAAGGSSAMPEVVEISIPVTPSMDRIQGSLASAMESCLKELGHHKFLGLEFDLTVSNNLFRDFGRSIQRQLDKRWHLVSRKTKQITRDLSTLRRLAFCVLRYDGPTFLQYLEMLRATEGVNSIWLFLDEAHLIFDEAKRRVYRVVAPDVKVGATSAAPHKVVPVLEQPGKWAHLKQVLEEVQRDRRQMLGEDGAGCSQSLSQSQGGEDPLPILVLTQEKLVGAQLEAMLRVGGLAIMKEAFNQYLEWREVSAKGGGGGGKTAGASRGSKKGRGGDRAKAKANDQSLKMKGAAGSSKRHEDAALRATSPLDRPGVSKGKKRKKAGGGPGGAEEAGGGEEGTPHLMEGVHFYALEGRELELELHRLRPAFVVLYDQSPAAIRELEVYSASALLCPEARQDRLLRIYMLFYAESLEQQKFCAAVDRERKVFKSLIQQKAVMMCPISEDGKAVVERPQGGLGDPLGTAVPLLPFGSGGTANNAITRNAGGLLARAKKRAGEVVVDMREFGSSLPGVLHAHGFRVSPCTLEVGDYVLSPEICVERKSIPDLIQSFTTGRLYTQAQAMAKHYKYPVLLIEFSGDKAFALQGVDDWSSGGDISQRALGSKLALLAIHVPKLRVIWSRSTQATADVFEQLKSNQEEPSLETAQQIGIPEDPHLRNAAESNEAALDVLRRLPGVTAANFRQLARAGVTLSGAAAMSEAELKKAMSSAKGAKALYNLLNSPCVGVPSIN